MDSRLLGLARELRGAVDDCNRERALNLCANETLLSETARRYVGSQLGEGHQEGTSRTRSVNGRTAFHHGFTFTALPEVYEVGDRISAVLGDLLGAEGVDLRLSSGMHAMLSTLLATTHPGDLVVSLHPDDGGHFATRFLSERCGRRHQWIPWDNTMLDIRHGALRELAQAHPPDVVYLDQGAPLYPLDLGKLRDAVGPRPTIVYDGSHTLGLIAGGRFQSPLREGADILQGNTHKTFPGPQKACLAFRDASLRTSIQDLISSGLVSSQHTHHVLALLAASLEMALYGQPFADQMISNAQALGRFLDSKGLETVRRGATDTETNQVLIRCGSATDACEFSAALAEAGVFVNSKEVYGTSVIRIGTQEVTRRGMKERQMETIAGFIFDILSRAVPPEATRQAVDELHGEFSQVHYSLDSLDQRDDDASAPH